MAALRASYFLRHNCFTWGRAEDLLELSILSITVEENKRGAKAAWESSYE